MRARPTAGSVPAALLLVALGVVPAGAQEFGPWHALGPFDHPGGANEVASPQAVERELAGMVAGGAGPDLGAEHRGKGGARIRWRPLRGEAGEARGLDVGQIDFLVALEPPAGVEKWGENAVCYLYRRIECAESASVAVQLGSDDGMRLWLNGALLVDKGIPRALNLGDEMLGLRLQAGVNHLFVKVAQGGGGWAFRMAPWARISQEAIDQAIDRGVEYLLGAQNHDGSWGKHERWGSGQTAFCLYALLKCGIAPSHPAARRALAWMRARPSGYTYSVACELLALCALGEEADAAWRDERMRALVDLHDSSGLYAYPAYPDGTVPPADLSNSLFAALALRAARQAGHRVPERSWRRLIDGTLRCVERGAERRMKYDARGSTGFTYRAEGEATGSMTAAGLSVLAICDEALERKHSKQVAERLELLRRGGLRWLEEHMTWARNPLGGHHYFFIYGVERVGGLLGLDVIGGVDWYWSGADYLVRNQRASGAWSSDAEYVDTVLALLFLRRATVPTSGRREGRARHYASEEEGAELVLRASGDAALAMWVEELPRELCAALEWPGEARQGPRIEKVEFFARAHPDGEDHELIAALAGDPQRPSGARRFAAQHEFRAAGEYALLARAHVLEPPLDAGRPPEKRVLESRELVVRVLQGADPELLRYATDLQRNLLAAESPRMRASSSLDAADGPEHAVDGLASTRWRSAADDARPWIELELARSVRTSRVLLSHASPRASEREGPRARRVELLFNGKESHVLELDPDVLRKSVLELENPVRVRQLRVTILESSTRTLGTDGVGFSEIELQ